jgi:hypothetical protein
MRAVGAQLAPGGDAAPGPPGAPLAVPPFPGPPQPADASHAAAPRAQPRGMDEGEGLEFLSASDGAWYDADIAPSRVALVGPGRYALKLCWR